MSTVADNRGGWWPWIREPYAGAWQRNDEWTVDMVLQHPTVFACITQIAGDFAKLRPKLVQLEPGDIWTEVTAQSPFHPVLRKPNRFQNHIQFKESWQFSKLAWGNTYVLKERDNRGVVRALYVLDPHRVQVLVAPDGSVFYALQADNLSSVQEAVTVPASEIIHDRVNCMFHPLVGVSPLFASGGPANIGLKIQTSAAGFFGNGANPSGILTAPGNIPKEVADRIKEHWDRNYSGDNSGKVAVLGNDLKFMPLRMSSVDAQVVEHLKWSDEAICKAFKVPAFKVGVGQMPTYQNGEILNQRYYDDCLQFHIESFEECMDEGLGLLELKDGKRLGVELDLQGLLRMDQATQYKTYGEGVKNGILAPNEARRQIGLKPVKGGDTPYLQQQNFSLAALDERDRNAPAPSDNTPAPAIEADEPDEPDIDDEQARALLMRRFEEKFLQRIAA